MHLRAAACWKYLVSHKPAGGGALFAIAIYIRWAIKRIPREQFFHCDGPSSSWFMSGRAVVWRDASHASSASDSTWGADRAIAVVGSVVGRDGSSKSFAEQSYRLAVVRGLAGGIRRDRGSRGAASIEGANPRE